MACMSSVATILSVTDSVPHSIEAAAGTVQPEPACTQTSLVWYPSMVAQLVALSQAS